MILNEFAERLERIYYFIITDGGLMQKAYYAFSEYLKEKFGEKVYNIPLYAGFSFANSDGTS